MTEIRLSMRTRILMDLEYGAMFVVMRALTIQTAISKRAFSSLKNDLAKRGMT